MPRAPTSRTSPRVDAGSVAARRAGPTIPGGQRGKPPPASYFRPGRPTLMLLPRCDSAAARGRAGRGLSLIVLSTNALSPEAGERQASSAPGALGLGLIGAAARSIIAERS